ncbi:MAG: amidase [Gammaproteobacteria bacterium]|nr:amidase [Gammaproteobacteria bacterium]
MHSYTRRQTLHAGLAMAASTLGGGAAMAMVRPPRRLPDPWSQFERYDALQLGQMVRNAEVHPRELLEAVIERVERLEPGINALSQRMFDLALEQIDAGLPEGPFTGVPFPIKDLGLQVAGTPTLAGSRLFAGHVARIDSDVVRRYRAAGLVLFAKTTTPELGLTGTTESILHGRTRNPWNPALIAGGSSGGAGAAVASRMVPMANASDGAGSIRTPASCCGVFGLKPTRGRVPLGPMRSEGWQGLSTVHAITLSVRDSAALLDATAGPAEGAFYVAPPPERPWLEETQRPPGRLRIALAPRPPGNGPVHPDCTAAVLDAARLCESLGHHVEEAQPPVDVGAMNDALLAVLAVETRRILEDRAAELGREPQPEDVEPVTWMFAEMAAQYSALDYSRARESFQRITVDMARFMRHHDVLLSPTLAMPPLPLGVINLSPPDIDRMIAQVMQFGPFAAVFNVSGQPSMSVPLFWNGEGVPIGSMFSARYGDEATLFRLAAQLETARSWHGRIPMLSA